MYFVFYDDGNLGEYVCARLLENH